MSPYRDWLLMVEEFPKLRGDLEYKLEYFICWRIAHGIDP